MTNPQFDFFVSSPPALEQLLARELTDLGCENVTPGRSGVSFHGTLESAFRVMLWSRVANRVLMPLANFEAATPEQLYDGVRRVDWSEHLLSTGSFAVDCSTSQALITHSHYAALRVKDAIVDQFRDRSGERPSIELETPDLRINLFLRRSEATLSLDLSGGSLHRRGYRLDPSLAPLKENLAAAILLYGKWPELAKQGAAFVDPMCGSGTLALEAALIAADIAPGLSRQHTGIAGWLQRDEGVWNSLVEEAEQRRAAGMANLPEIHCFDRDGRVLDAARQNAQRAGLSSHIQFMRRDIKDLKCPQGLDQSGLVAVNPPYGERLGDNIDAVEALYRTLGERLKSEFSGWKALVMTGRPELGPMLGLQSVHRNSLYNGALRCQLLHFNIEPSRFREAPKSSREREGQRVDQAQQGMFANRLKKNLSRLSRWAKREGVQCYRLYDADMPEYAVAIDRYGDSYHVQEYAAPKNVSELGAQKRLQEVMDAAPTVLGVSAESIHLKVRKRQKGSEQYRKMGQSERFEIVREGQCRFRVNLQDYLDTGLFLDHRPMRLRIGAEASGRTFLNLFAYTATATVHAALGGASASTSVDMSGTYIDWARKNFELNGMDLEKHRLVRANCLEWLRLEKGNYDIIFLDPPTFSNSKSMDDHFDVQRDHAELIRLCAGILSPGGVLYFSTNSRKFSLDAVLSEELCVKDISKESIAFDFERNARIHQCWKISPSDR